MKSLVSDKRLTEERRAMLIAKYLAEAQRRVDDIEKAKVPDFAKRAPVTER